MDRREMLGAIGFGAVGLLGWAGRQEDASAAQYAHATKGLPALKITDVKAIVTAPQEIGRAHV